MAFRVSISVFGDKQFDREVLGVGRRARYALPLYDHLGHKLSAIQREQFATSGSRGGRPWAPLAPRTVEAKVAHGSPTPERPLEDSGALRESFVYGDANQIFEATPDYLLWGSDIDYGGFHQPDKQGRRVFELTEADRIEIVKDMQYWVRYGKVALG